MRRGDKERAGLPDTGHVLGPSGLGRWGSGLARDGTRDTILDTGRFAVALQMGNVGSLLPGNHVMRQVLRHIAWMTLLASPGSQAGPAPADVLEGSGVKGGLVVCMGCETPQHLIDLRASDAFLVHGLGTDRANVRRAREYVHSRRLYGKVSADRFDGRHLPYAGNLVNLVVAEGRTSRVSRDEILRALVPGGVAYVSGTRTVKPWPDGIGRWSHWMHAADGNAVAADRIVGPPKHVQWIAEPRWQRHHEASPSLDAMVSAGGRLFAIVNEALPGIDTLPDRWALVARDAFNGKLLWKRPIARWGWREWSDRSHGHGRWNQPTQIARRLVAVGNRVYVTLGFNAPLPALDAETGQTVMTCDGTGFTDEILYHEGTLVLSVSTGAQGPGRIARKPALKKAVMAIDAASGRTLWRTQGLSGASSKGDAIERITHLVMVVGGGNVFCVEENAITALDLFA
jgi:outer membrane protein assembly factor BamB